MLKALGLGAAVTPLLLRGGRWLPPPAGELPLGPAGLTTREGPVQEVAPGVVLRSFTRGHASGHWTVAVHTGDTLLAPDADAADATAAGLHRQGFPARVRERVAPQSADARGGTVGYDVWSGSYAARADAERALRRLESAGAAAELTHTAAVGTASTGPWSVCVVEAQPWAAVRARNLGSGNMAVARTVRELAHDHDALAAVNAAYFDIRTNAQFGGYEGDPLGILMDRGRLLSEANNGRTAVLFGAGPADTRIAELSTDCAVFTPDGRRYPIGGINRVPGRILGCGSAGGRSPVEGADPSQPQNFVLCTDPDDLVLFDDAWGTRTPRVADDAVEVVLGTDGTVREQRVPAGGPVPSGGRVLSGIGAAARRLREIAPTGTRLTVTTGVRDARGPVAVGPDTSIVAGGPALLRHGDTWINTRANGMVVPATGGPSTVLTERLPRTAVGTAPDGRLVLVAVDGRSPGHSVGATLHELAGVLRWLGATDALALDGGGSTTMIADGELVNRPTGDWGGEVGEREVATALALTKT
ncbi:phosphodiester glycosidase family protein [Streptomyces sp. NPDC059009]|uniref:phosphodiester glycosidase family protein n=1 Tax=Streptomyces sp. NPDC059009 TaxID=3346694 RepID=UPI0036C36115